MLIRVITVLLLISFFIALVEDFSLQAIPGYILAFGLVFGVFVPCLDVFISTLSGEDD